jgi:cytochrome d ubiquinol oxidase subunit I
MIENIDISTVDWSRAQFALTAMFHYIFVPLTLGLSFIIAVMESMWVKTGNEEWKRATKFWMKLFGINFAIGVSTGIILEFEFGTNWSNYSWFVGDIFGAPLAIEGMMAFFMESTFIAIMFFGWEKVSKRMHLLSSWLVFIGGTLSALWILVANAWMQNPVGMIFNPDTARNEMGDFWAVLFSPTAMNKFTHTALSAYLLSAVFVLGVSSWYLLKKRHISIAKKSILVASIFGLAVSILTVYSGDTSSRDIAKVQPMKFAAMEGLYEGGENAPLVLAGIISTNKDGILECEHGIEIPSLLSLMTHYKSDAFVPGIKNVLEGFTDNDGKEYLPVDERIARGKLAKYALRNYKNHKKKGNKAEMKIALQDLRDNYSHFGYGYLDSPKEAIPNVYLTFYSFHIMVGIGLLFMLLFIVSCFLVYKKKIEKYRWILWTNLICIPLAYIAIQCGWIVTELGRQPWVVQDLMTTKMAATDIDTAAVQTTFWLFAILFSALLTAEIKILLTQIRKGPKEGEK